MHECNPYRQQIAEEGGKKLQEEKIQEAFARLPEVLKVRGYPNITKRATLDRELLEHRIQHFQQKGIVINTGRTHVNRNDIMRWVEFVFEREMGAYIEQIKVMSWFNFLVIVGTYEEQQQILGALLLYMDGKVIIAVHQETNLNNNPIGVMDTPLWIELVLVDLVLEIYFKYLFGRASRLVYASTSTSLNRFAHIRGCILMDMDKPLVTQLSA